MDGMLFNQKNKMNDKALVANKPLLEKANGFSLEKDDVYASFKKDVLAGKDEEYTKLENSKLFSTDALIEDVERLNSLNFADKSKFEGFKSYRSGGKRSGRRDKSVGFQREAYNVLKSVEARNDEIDLCREKLDEYKDKKYPAKLKLTYLKLVDDNYDSKLEALELKLLAMNSEAEAISAGKAEEEIRKKSALLRVCRARLSALEEWAKEKADIVGDAVYTDKLYLSRKKEMQGELQKIKAEARLLLVNNKEKKNVERHIPVVKEKNEEKKIEPAIASKKIEKKEEKKIEPVITSKKTENKEEKKTEKKTEPAITSKKIEKKEENKKELAKTNKKTEKKEEKKVETKNIIKAKKNEDIGVYWEDKKGMHVELETLKYTTNIADIYYEKGEANTNIVSSDKKVDLKLKFRQKQPGGTHTCWAFGMQMLFQSYGINIDIAQIARYIPTNQDTLEKFNEYRQDVIDRYQQVGDHDELFEKILGKKYRLFIRQYEETGNIIDRDIHQKNFYKNFIIDTLKGGQPVLWLRSAHYCVITGFEYKNDRCILKYENPMYPEESHSIDLEEAILPTNTPPEFSALLTGKALDEAKDKLAVHDVENSILEAGVPLSELEANKVEFEKTKW